MGLIEERIEELKYMFRTMSKKKMLAGVLCFLLISCICGAGVYSTAMRQEQKEVPKKEVKKEEVIEVTKVEEKVPEVEPTAIQMEATSLEKDLKIKILDLDSNLVTGQTFEVKVSKEGQEEGTIQKDEDQDGVLAIKELEAGEYTLEFQAKEGFTIENNPIQATVKDKVEYVKVDVTDEVKTEAEINVQEEDTGRHNVPVEAPPAEEPVVETPAETTPVVDNGLPLLESTVISETCPVENIDTSNFPSASVSTEKSEITIGTASVKVPSQVQLYLYGAEKSKTCQVDLEVSDAEKLIQSISWSVADQSVATVINQSTASATVQQGNAGSTTLNITVNYKEAETTVSQTITSQVMVSAFTDAKTLLKDINGTALYLDQAGKTPATLKDYGVVGVFYYAPKYTGWQTIDGAVYYFNENHQPVTGQQKIDGKTYLFNDKGVLQKEEPATPQQPKEKKGIDVSKWNKNIDWKAVANAGIDFAIIRVGYRGSSTGVLVEDPYFRQNIKGATQNGIEVGVYFFSQAITEAEAVEEASMAISSVSGYHLSYPIFIDTESSGGRADALNKSDRTKIVNAFCKTVANAGYKPGVYSGKYWYMNKLNASELEHYTIWVAQYNTVCNYPGKYDIWQYTSTGKVPGISGNVDLNIDYR